MKNNKGFVAMTAIIIIGIIVLGGVGYVALKPKVSESPTIPAEENKNETTQTSETKTQTKNGKSSIVWKFTSAGEVDAMPKTKVAVLINGKTYDVGTFTGSCSEVGATGGVDGKGLLAGELSAAQCWFAGGGDEIGVFAHEDGGFDIMVGQLGEGEEGAGVFRGNFEVKTTIEL